MKNILLIMPRIFEKENYIAEMHLGIMYISSVLKQAGHNVKCINLGATCGPVEDIVSENLENIDTIGITCGAIDFNQVRSISRKVKLLHPEIRIIIGGALPTSEPELILRECEADVVVIGEGEITMIELMQNVKLHEINGIGFLHGNQFICTPPRSPIRDLDELPYPDHDGFGIKLAHDMAHPMLLYAYYPFENPKVVQVMTSRGCPHSCTFCGHTLPKNVRFRSIESIKKEILHYKAEYDINLVYFCDEMLSHSKKRILSICEMMLEIGLPWSAMFRVDVLDEYTIKTMKASGCYFAVVGIESGDSGVLKSMKKSITVQQSTKVLNLLRKYKIGIQGNLIFGDPAETENSIVNSLRWWLDNKFFFILLRFIFPFPGSHNYDQAVKRGLIKDKIRFLESYCPQINLTRLDDNYMFNMVPIVNKLMIENRPISRSSIKPLDNGFIKIDAICSECGDSFSYNRFIPQDWALYEDGQAKIFCRRCNQQTSIDLWHDYVLC